MLACSFAGFVIVQFAFGFNAYPFTYQYNRDDTIQSQSYPSGRTVTFSYDQAGRPTGVSGQTPYVSPAQYHPHGAIKWMSVANSQRLEQSCFNDRLQPKAIRLGATATTDCALGAGDLLHLAFGYETANNGNVRTQTITAPRSPSNLVLSQNYAYDGVNRIASAEETSVNGWSETYGYDAYGNRGATGGGLPLSPLKLPPGSFNASNRVAIAAGCTPATMGSYEWCYDQAGNLIKNKLGETFAYDAENRQVAYCRTDPAGCPNTPGSGRTRYFYDGDGRRVKREASDGKVTIFAYDTFGNLTAEYSQEQYMGPTGTFYRTTDHLGSTRLVTKQDGTVLARQDFTPFGEELFNTVGERSTVAGYGVDLLRHKFTGKERDAESGLDFFGARYLSSAQGRFTSPDPFNFLQEAGSREDLDEYLSNPQHWNKYGYSLNNPLKYVDPDGKHPVLIYLSQLLQRAANSPTGQRAMNYASTQGTRLYNAATQFFNSPTGQEVTQAVAETALGYQGPSFNPVRAAENFGLRGIASEAGLITGRLASGAEVWAGFEKTGQNLAVSVLGAFNPDNLKGSLGTLKAITEGAFNAARAEGASTVTIRGIAVVNQKLGTFLQKQGFQLKKIKLPDGTEVDAYEKTFTVN